MASHNYSCQSPLSSPYLLGLAGWEETGNYLLAVIKGGMETIARPSTSLTHFTLVPPNPTLVCSSIGAHSQPPGQMDQLVFSAPSPCTPGSYPQIHPAWVPPAFTMGPSMECSPTTTPEAPM